MNVLLINPPVRHPPGINIGTENRAQSPPLGLLYLASSLERGGHRVTVVDCGGAGGGWDGLRENLRGASPDLVGVTATTPSFRNALTAARLTKELHPGVPLVMGGYHPTYFSREILARIPEVDLVCRGEGEFTLLELAEGRPREGIAGLSFRNGRGEIVATPDRPLCPDLDRFPFPARHLVRHNRYGSMGGLIQMADPRRYTALITSRGCPCACRYCCVTTFSGRLYRTRSVADIEAEVRALRAKGIDTLYLQDDCFAINKNLPEICEVLAGHRITWFCLARTDTKPEHYPRMARSGCRAIYFGVESFSPRVLAYFRKNTTLPQIEGAIRQAKAAGLDVLITLILGAPVETAEDVELNRMMLEALDIDLIELNLLTYYPFTPLWSELSGAQRAWDREVSVLEVRGEHSAPELASRVAYLKRAFYKRPRYVARQFVRTLRYRRDLLSLNLPNIPKIARYLARDASLKEARGVT